MHCGVDGLEPRLTMPSSYWGKPHVTTISVKDRDLNHIQVWLAENLINLPGTVFATKEQMCHYNIETERVRGKLKDKK